MAKNVLNPLVGKRIDAVWFDPRISDKFVGFETEGAVLWFYTDADCCSESWIYELSGVENLVGQTVIEVREIDGLPRDIEDEYTRQEFDDVYAYEVATARGVFRLEFRNSSNGYYGGSLEAVTEPLAADDEIVCAMIGAWSEGGYRFGEYGPRTRAVWVPFGRDDPRDRLPADGQRVLLMIQSGSQVYEAVFDARHTCIGFDGQELTGAWRIDGHRPAVVMVNRYDGVAAWAPMPD